MKPCEICRKDFEPTYTSTQRVCSLACARKVSILKRKKEAADFKARKIKAKRRADWAKEAEQQVNRYVRLRDHAKGCVSCDKPATWGGQWHASHFRSVGAASAVRYNLWNIHKACSECNRRKAGNLLHYEPRLRAMIGDDKVSWLRAQNEIVRYSVEYLDRLKRVMRRRANRLEKRIAKATGEEKFPGVYIDAVHRRR